MALVNGRDLAVKDSNGIIAFSKTCEINVTCDMIPASSSTAGDYEHVRPGRKGWTVNVDCLYSTGKVDLGLTFPGQYVMLTFGIRGELSSTRRYGWAYCSSCRFAGSVGILSKYTAQFKGDGGFTSSST